MHRIVFVTGKGGVGKSTVAAATALRLARAGQRVLLVELGSRSFFRPLFGMQPGRETLSWIPGMHIACWDVESALREYIAHYLVFKVAADTILNSTVMKALVATAPGLAEMALLGKLTAPMRHGWYKRDVDVVVVDAYATGQFMALLRAPRGLAQTATGGRMHTHSLTTTKILSDPAICEYRLVTLAEELPVAEAREMAVAMQEETGIAPRIYCNRLLELPARLPPVAPDDPAAPFVHNMARIAVRQRRSLAALDALEHHRAGPVRKLPLVPVSDPRPMLERLADALDAEAEVST